MESNVLKSEDTSSLEDCVMLAKAGDEGAIVRLIEMTQDRLFRFCLYLTGGKASAQDLTQDTFVRVLENLKTLKEPAQFNSWLYRIARNCFLNQVRGPRGKKNKSLDDLKHEPPIAAPGDPEVNLHLSRTLQTLSAEERSLILLVDLEGHSYAEVAKILEVSEDSIRSKLHRVRKTFTKKFYTK